MSHLVLDAAADRMEIVVGLPRDVRAFFSEPRLGQRYRCFTGISTGNDREYLRAEPAPGHGVPFYKNPGRQRFYCPPDAYLPDDYERIAEQVPNFMVRNRRWLRREGLVCSSMGVPFGACHRPAETTFGVNANVLAPKDPWWLLAYLNSSLVTCFVRGVLARSNMVTAGYVARIPVPELSARTRGTLSRLAHRAYQDRVSADEALASVARIDEALEAELGLAPETVAHLRRFARELIKRT